MIDPTDIEKQAMQKAGQYGGEYLEHLKKTDVGEMSVDEWATFVECIVTGYTESMQNAAPF